MFVPFLGRTHLITDGDLLPLVLPHAHGEEEEGFKDVAGAHAVLQRVPPK